MKTTIFLALFMSVLSTSAMAETVKSEVTVSFAELNLQNEAGVRTLYTRLVEASKTACGANVGYTLVSTSILNRQVIPSVRPTYAISVTGDRCQAHSF